MRGRRREDSDAVRRPGYFFWSIPVISPGSGNLPTAFFENTSFPSAKTSNTPPAPAVSFDSTPIFSKISAARPAARGL